MKLSARAIYAYKAIFELAGHYGRREPLRIATISQRQKIPANFLLQLLILLKNAGIVVSARGVSGGYLLAKDPSCVTLAEVLRAVDGNIGKDAPARRSSARGGAESDRLLWEAWSEANKLFIDRLEKITFDALLSRACSKTPMYHI
jgi:Rrf2 family protein